MAKAKNAASPDCAQPAGPEPGAGRAAILSQAVRFGQADRFGRAEILGKYWELANLDPELTKGTITGQLKALDSLCQELALEETDDGQAAGQPKQQIYRSAWMRESALEAPVKEVPASKRPSSTRTRAKAADDE